MMNNQIADESVPLKQSSVPYQNVAYKKCGCCPLFSQVPPGYINDGRKLQIGPT